MPRSSEAISPSRGSLDRSSVSFAEGSHASVGEQLAKEHSGSVGEHGSHNRSSELVLTAWQVPEDAVCRSCVCKIPAHGDREFGNGLLVRCHHRPYVLTSNTVFNDAEAARGVRVILGPEPQHAAEVHKHGGILDNLANALNIGAGLRSSFSFSRFSGSVGEHPKESGDGSKELPGQELHEPDSARNLKLEHPPFPEILLQPDLFFLSDEKLGFAIVGVRHSDVKSRSIVDMASHGDHPHPAVGSTIIAWEREVHGGHVADLFEAIVEERKGNKVVISSETDNRVPGTAFFQKNTHGHGSHLVALRHQATHSVDRSECFLVSAVARTVESHIIVATMRLHAEKSSSLEKECISLRRLTAHDGDSKRSVAAAGGLQQILLAIERHADTASLIEQACAVLRNLACEPEVLTAMLEADAVQMLCRLVTEHGDHVGVQEHGLATLCNIACSELGREQAFSAGLLDLVRLTIANNIEQVGNPESIRLLEQCVAALWNLGTNNIEAQSDIQSHGGMKLLCTIMEKHEDSPAVIATACGALGNLVAGNPSNRAAVAAEYGVKHIIDAMNAHETDVEVQRQGCGALWSLIANSELNQAEAVAEGAITLVLAAMHDHAQSKEVQENGCGALRNLIVFKAENKEEAAGAGAVDKICEGMSSHIQSVGVQRQACGALWNLSAGSPALQLDLAKSQAFENICKGVEAHSTVLAVSENACGAIRNLATSNDKVKAATWTSDRCAAFCKLLKDSQSNAVLQRQGFEILQLFCAAGTGFCDDVVRADGVECICSGMGANTDNEIVQERACFALQTLLHLSPAAVSRFLKCDGLEILSSTMEAHPHNIPVLHQALNLLEAVAGKDGLKWPRLEKAGAIGQVTDAMDNHPKSSNIQEAGLRVFKCLCKRRAGGRTAVMKVSGLDRTVMTLAGHATSVPVQEHGCAVLANLSEGGENELRQKVADCRGAIKVLVDAMSTHPSSENVNIEAIRALKAVLHGGEKAVVLFVKFRGAGILVATMQRLNESVEVQSKSLELLQVLSEYSEGQQNIIEFEGLKQANKAMIDHVDNLPLQRLAMKVFDHYFSTDEHRLLVGEAGVFPSLASCMKKHEGDRLLQRDACRSIDGLVQGLQVNQSKAAQTPIVDLICKAIVKFETDVKIFACEALCSLAVCNATNKAKIAKSGCLPEICRAMATKPGDAPPEAPVEPLSPKDLSRTSAKSPRDLQEKNLSRESAKSVHGSAGSHSARPESPTRAETPKSPSIPFLNEEPPQTMEKTATEMTDVELSELQIYQDLVVQCTTLLWCLAANCKAARVTVNASNAINQVCQGMTDYPQHVAIQERSCAALAAFSKNDRAGQARVVKADGLRLVCEAMNNHPEAEPVQRYAAAALWSMANNNLDTKLTIVGLGGITCMAEAMTKHEDSAILHAQSCAALWQLAASGDDAREIIAKAEILEIVAKAMLTHREHASFARHACQLLRVLACGGAKMQAAIVKIEGLEKVCGAMVMHLDNAALQLQGIAALGNIAFKNKDHKDQLRLAGGLDLILTAMETHLEVAGIQEFGCWALANLAANHWQSAQAISNAQAHFHISAAMDTCAGNPGVQSMGYAAERRLEAFPPQNASPRAKMKKDRATAMAVLKSPRTSGEARGGPIVMTEEMMANFESAEDNSDSDEEGGDAGKAKTKKRRCALM